MLGERLSEEKERLSELAPPGTDVRREHEIARQVLAEREEKMLLTAWLSPPAYVVKELGERPDDLTKAKAWDRGVREIESYRKRARRQRQRQRPRTAAGGPLRADLLRARPESNPRGPASP